MSPLLLFSFVIGYFLILLAVAWHTGKNSSNHSFFIGNKNSNWMLVAFGMIGTSLSGVTFVSVPGAVAKESFAYFQITLGYLFGYLIIAYLLLPLYYRLNLTSIYHYLNTRLGFKSYKTGSSFFILSRVLGATARLYLVVNILQEAILNSFHIPFWATTLIILIMILLYTYEGGVKTIVYTDTLQTSCMLLGLIICVIYILTQLKLGFTESIEAMSSRGYTKIFFTDPNSKLFFLKQIIAGAFITATMTGMDQEMMQKNISVKTLKDSQKNVLSMAIVLITVILLFLFLGGLLYLYADQLGLTVKGDKIFPTIALNHMPPFVSVIFIIALISALFPSADGAITALTSTFCIDIIGIHRRTDLTEIQQKKMRQKIHLAFAALFLLFVMAFKWINDPSMIGLLLKIAAYTYGPLLGLFTFGILTQRSVADKFVPYICIGSPIICFLLDKYQKKIFGSFELGLELLLINGAITFLGLLLISQKKKRSLYKPSLNNTMDMISPMAEKYITAFSSPESTALAEISTTTYKNHPAAHMLSGHIQGKFLSFLSFMLKPKFVLEIGSFTGYSALCLADGLLEDGELHTIELREEDAATAASNFSKYNKNKQVTLHVGNAKNIIEQLPYQWDLVFIDADKTGYIDYYELVLPRLSNNGIIIADNILFHGQVLANPITGKNAKAIHAFNIHVQNDPRTEQVMLSVRDGIMIIKKTRA